MTTPTVDELRAGLPRAAAEAQFDALPAVGVDEIVGRWRGSEVPTGHPMDGLLEVSGWYGKQFDDPDHVHPLLFGRPGDFYAVNPKLIPMTLLDSVGPRLPKHRLPGSSFAFRALRTRRHRARLRAVEYRGTVSAAMVYDDLPIIDNFRRLNADALLGAMDLRDSPAPYFFLLERDGV
ncbi:MAG: GXWXG domain-containing protein [Gordonia sp. (in: high G+C Gram-positive bacteria)]|uniref:GXWXG domain-containing protein n=1 Tax=Gordonia TaxID=2053 RepID=UPI0032673199